MNTEQRQQQEKETWENVKLKNYAQVETLLSNNINPNLTCALSGDSILMQAIHDESVSLVQLLIKYKANVNHKNKDGFTPLMYSSFYSSSLDLSIMDFLINNKADLNIITFHNFSALSIAIVESMDHKMELLLKSNADPNLKIGTMPGKSSLLDLSISLQNTKITKLLLDYKANPNVENCDYLLKTVTQNSQEICKCLLSYDTCVSPLTETAMLSNDSFKYLLRQIKWGKELGVANHDLFSENVTPSLQALSIRSLSLSDDYDDNIGLNRKKPTKRKLDDTLRLHVGNE